jgi:hypothetical protein
MASHRKANLMKNKAKLMKTLAPSDINSMASFAWNDAAAGLASPVGTAIWGTSPIWHGATQVCSAIWGTCAFWTPPKRVQKPLPSLQLTN